MFYLVFVIKNCRFHVFSKTFLYEMFDIDIGRKTKSILCTMYIHMCFDVVCGQSYKRP